MIGRIERTNVSSQCGTAKEYPGDFGTIERVFDTFGPFVNPAEEAICATIFWDFGDCIDAQARVLAHPAVYSSFDPADKAAGYLGDVGPSVQTEFSIDLMAGESFSVVVMQVLTGPIGIGCNYRFLVDLENCETDTSPPTTTTVPTSMPTTNPSTESPTVPTPVPTTPAPTTPAPTTPAPTTPAPTPNPTDSPTRAPVEIPTTPPPTPNPSPAPTDSPTRQPTDPPTPQPTPPP
eukprot:scaffold1771_cov172-Amphora_coffeaeformis.AAC.1